MGFLTGPTPAGLVEKVAEEVVRRRLLGWLVLGAGPFSPVWLENEGVLTR